MRRLLTPSRRLLSDKVGRAALLRVAAAEAGRASAAASASSATARGATGKAAAAVQIQQSVKRQKKQKKKQQHAAVRASLDEANMCRVSAAIMGSSHYGGDLASLLGEQFGRSAVMPIHETEGAVHSKLLPEALRTESLTESETVQRPDAQRSAQRSARRISGDTPGSIGSSDDEWSEGRSEGEGSSSSLSAQLAQEGLIDGVLYLSIAPEMVTSSTPLSGIFFFPPASSSSGHGNVCVSVCWGISPHLEATLLRDLRAAPARRQIRLARAETFERLAIQREETACALGEASSLRPGDVEEIMLSARVGAGEQLLDEPFKLDLSEV